MVKILDVVGRLSRTDRLIHNKQTRNSSELAKTSKLSKNQTFNYLDYLKDRAVDTITINQLGLIST